MNDITDKNRLEKLQKENYELGIVIEDLINLNRNILNEIISKHYMFTVEVNAIFYNCEGGKHDTL